MSALDLIVAKFRKGSPNIALAFDEVQRRLVQLEVPTPVPIPVPIPVPTPASLGSLDVYRHTFYPDSHGEYPGGETHSWHWLVFDSPNTAIYTPGSDNQSAHGTVRWGAGG